MEQHQNPFKELGQKEKLDRLCSYEAIRQLVANYAYFMDEKNLKAVTGLFVPDVKVSKDTTGRQALETELDKLLDGIGTTILKVATHKIDFQDADSATGIVYAHGDIQMGNRWLYQTVRYGDKYKRLDGVWLFVGRKHQFWYSADVGENPLNYPPANWPESNIGLGDLSI